jgi:hypothetical protein
LANLLGLYQNIGQRVLKKVAVAVISITTMEGKGNKIASGLVSLTEEAIIPADVF